MNTKILILIAWLLYFALLQSGDKVWLFYLVYSCVLATCAFLYNLEHKSRASKEKKKT